jgi:hypothetical protein
MGRRTHLSGPCLWKRHRLAIGGPEVLVEPFLDDRGFESFDFDGFPPSRLPADDPDLRPRQVEHLGEQLD